MSVTTASKRIDQVWLVRAAALFTVAVLVHNFDHTRRGSGSVDADVAVAGTLAIFVEVGVVLLAAMRHPEATRAALATGLTLAAGYLFVHFLPDRGWLSDSFPSAEYVNPFSWAAASFEVVAALALAYVGWRLLDARDPSRPLSLREGLRHPVPAAMLVGNVVLLAAGAV